MRITGLYYNNSIKTALRHKARILGGILHQEGGIVKPNLYGDDVKMVSKITKKQKALTSVERDEIVEKYENGMDVQPIADLYGCHRTTVSRLLRTRGVEIRKST